MKRFVKRNIKYILTTLLLLFLLCCAIRGIHIRSVQEVRQEAQELAGITGNDSLESQGRNGQNIDSDTGTEAGNPVVESSNHETMELGESTQNQTEVDGETDNSEKSEAAQTDTSGEGAQSKSNKSEKSHTAGQNDASNNNKSDTSNKKAVVEKNKKTSAGGSGKTTAGKQATTQKTGKSKKKQTKTSTSASSKRKISDGRGTKPDQYHTDPVPSGRPEPVNAEDQSVNQKKSFYVYLSIDVLTILDHMEDLKAGLQKYVPADGWILPKTQVLCYEGETAWDVMSRECKARGINVQSSYTPLYNSVYMEGINHIGEFDCGATAGWVYEVNGWIPNYSSSRYVLVEGEYLRWRYSCTGFGSDLEGAVRQ
ncbi:MAG: DUF4430 domain-containing protein [Lachnospiraceae bacterium]|nr:DUF4430 domain-containing protein [Lachnospiraceae bacterium]